MTSDDTKITPTHKVTVIQTYQRRLEVEVDMGLPEDMPVPPELEIQVITSVASSDQFLQAPFETVNDFRGYIKRIVEDDEQTEEGPPTMC